jgi:hypothetical protein
MWEDPIVSEVRRVREELAARFGFDVHAIFEELRAKQTSLGSRLVRRPRRTRVEQAAPRDRDSAPLDPGR